MVMTTDPTTQHASPRAKSRRSHDETFQPVHVTEDIVSSCRRQVSSFRRSLEFTAGLLFPLLALPALAAQVMRHELPQINEGNY